MKREGKKEGKDGVRLMGSGEGSTMSTFVVCTVYLIL
jgi:hypothetical protein